MVAAEGAKPLPVSGTEVGGITQPVTGPGSESPYANPTTYGFSNLGTGFMGQFLPQASTGEKLLDDILNGDTDSSLEPLSPASTSDTDGTLEQSPDYMKYVQQIPQAPEETEFKPVSERIPDILVPLGAARNTETSVSNEQSDQGRAASQAIFGPGTIIPVKSMEEMKAEGKSGNGSKFGSYATQEQTVLDKEGNPVPLTASEQKPKATGAQPGQKPAQGSGGLPPVQPSQPQNNGGQKPKATGAQPGQKPAQGSGGLPPVQPPVQPSQPQNNGGQKPKATGAQPGQSSGYTSFNKPKVTVTGAQPGQNRNQNPFSVRPVTPSTPNNPPVVPSTPNNPPVTPSTPNNPSVNPDAGLKGEISNRARARAQAFGSKVLGASEDIYMVASNGLGEREIEKEARSLAFQSIRKYDDEVKALQAEKARKKAETSFGKFLANHKALSVGWGLVKIPISLPKAILVKTADTVKRTLALSDYYKTAKEAIEATGERSMGRLAVHQLTNLNHDNIKGAVKGKKRREQIVEEVKKLSDQSAEMEHDWSSVFDSSKSDEDVASEAMLVKGIYDPDMAILERAKQARRGREIGFESDSGIALESMEADNPVAKAIREFAKQVSNYDLSVDNDPDTSQAALDRKALEMQFRDAARQNVMDVINKEMGTSMNNAVEVVRLIERNLSGVLHNELQDPAKHSEALQAIDSYIDEHFHLDKFKVTKSGLTASEEDYAKLSEKAAIKAGAVAGIVLALGGSYATGLSKSFIIQHVTDSQVVMAGLKVFAAAGLGAARGIGKTKREQLKDNIDAALGLEVKENRGLFGLKIHGHDILKVKRKNFDSIMLDVDATTQQLIQGLENLGQGANMNQSVRDALIKQIGEIYAREQLESQKNGKIKTNLFKYRSRDEIERDKANMFKAINDIVDQLQDDGVNAAELIEQAQKDAYKTLHEAYLSIRRDQLSERYKVGARDGAIAGVAALAAVVTLDYFRGGKLMKEAKALRSGDKKLTFKNGIKVVDVEKPSQIAGAAGTAEQVINKQQVNNRPQSGTAESNKGPIGGEAGANKGGNVGNKDPHFEENSKSQLLIEDDPEGGQAIGFDRDGDGKIDPEEYLIGKEGEPGVNLNSESDLAGLNERLRPYGMEVTRDPSVGEKLVPMRVSDYVNSQPNAVKGMNIDDVNWNKSQQLCSIEKEIVVRPGDGAEIYDVTIDGNVPDGAKLYIDIDGDGPAAPLEYTITNNHAFPPASVLNVRPGGTAEFVGKVRVANIEDGQFISYTTNVGKTVSADDMINVRVEETGSVLSVIKHGGGAGGKDVVINQAAVNGEGRLVNNLSETFNGRTAAAGSTVSHVPYMLQEKVPAAGATAEVVRLENGAEIPNWEYKGGYKENFDSSLNYMFKEKASYVGTPMILDANGDGVIDATESAEYISQMFVRTGTNPYVLAQNASAYGLLDANNINTIFSEDELTRLGILDGKIDDLDELNTLIENLKLSSNSGLYDRLVNRTLEKMRTDLTGAKIEMIDLGARKATYLNNNNDLDLINASRTRTAATFYREVNGEKVYVGNGGLVGDGKRPVYDILACEQKGQKLRSEGSETSENSETSEDSEVSEGQEGTGSEDSENTENSENTETSEDSEGSEGQESTGSEDSESTESSENSETSEGQESTGSENSEDSEGTEGSEDSENSENSETTETSEDSEGSEGQEGTGSEDSETTESSETSETSEELEDIKQPPIGMDPDPISGQPEPIITPSPDPGVPETPGPIFEGGGTIVDDGAVIPTMDENLEEYYRLIGKKQ